jgi:hypothetical protein
MVDQEDAVATGGPGDGGVPQGLVERFGMNYRQYHMTGAGKVIL